LAPTLPATVDDLGLPGALDLGTLSLAQTRRLKVAPTRRATLAVLERLRHVGLINVPWPEPRWEVAPDARETPIEALQWRLAWTAYVPGELADACTDYLRSIPRDDYGIALRLRLWQELVIAEAESYFEYQLAKHQFDPAWAQDLTFVARDTRAEISAAQWRYCAWAATRQGATYLVQQRTPDPLRVREVIHAELGRRIGPVASGQWTNASFTPRSPCPDSALSRLFAFELTHLGALFWSMAPCDVALLAPAPARATASDLP
jgi:hypothetical protein